MAYIRTNTAVREAIGGDDVISKWQLMGEKHNRGSGTSSGAQASKDASDISLQTPGKTTKDCQQLQKGNLAATDLCFLRAFTVLG